MARRLSKCEQKIIRSFMDQYTFQPLVDLASVEVVKLDPNVKDRPYTHYLVRVAGKVVGRIEKWKNTRTEQHPWKAFRLFRVAGEEVGNRYLGCSYADAGRAWAIAAILAN